MERDAKRPIGIAVWIVVVGMAMNATMSWTVVGNS